MITPFRRIRTSTPELKNVQDAIATTVNDIVKCPILDGRLIKDIDLTTSELRVDHKLNRTPIGFLVVDNSASATIFKPTISTDKFLYLQASASTTVSIWVF